MSNSISLKDLLEAGSHFGHQGRRWNPSMKPYIFDERDGVHIFDLVKTKENLDRALEFVTNTVKSGGKVLFVGTKRQADALVKSEAMRVGMPFVTVRWLGGTLTNWQEINKRIFRLKDLKDKREKGELKKYTKREQLLLDREINKLERFLGGIASLEKLPAALFVVDTHREEVAVREAVRMHIPVVGMVDTNGDPSLVDYVIPINDDAVKSIELIVKAVSEAVEEGQKPETKKEEKKVEVAEVVESSEVKAKKTRKKSKEE